MMRKVARGIGIVAVWMVLGCGAPSEGSGKTSSGGAAGSAIAGGSTGGGAMGGSGGLGGGAGNASGGGGANGNAGSGGGSSGSPCDVGMPFGAPQPIAGVNTTANESGAWLSPDRLTIYFGSNRDNDLEIYRATRASASDAFETPIPLEPPVNIRGNSEGDPVLTPDELMMYFSRSLDIYVTTRGSTAEPWADPMQILSLSMPIENHPEALNADRSVLYLMSSLGPGTGNIYTSRITGTAYGDPEAIELEGDGAESDATPTPDGRTLYFSRGPSGDVWVARRPNDTAAFGTPTEVTELNSDRTDAPNWVSPDECTIIVSRYGRESMDHDLFIAERPR